jgi:outer membrane autotransporter protein
VYAWRQDRQLLSEPLLTANENQGRKLRRVPQRGQTMVKTLMLRSSLFKFLLLPFVSSLCLMEFLHAQTLSGIPGLEPPQAAVGRAIEVLCPMLSPSAPGSTGDLQIRCTELVGNAGNPDAVRNPLLQMTSKEVSSQGSSVIETSTIQPSNLVTRMSELRRGATGVSLMGIALHDLGKTPPSAAVASLWPGQDRATLGDTGAPNTFPKLATSFSGNSSEPMLAQGLSAGAGSSAGANPFGRLGIFVNGTFSFGDHDTTSREAGYDFDVYGVTGGVDYRFTDNLVLGLAFGYTDIRDEYTSARGWTDADVYTFSAFGTYYVGRFYVDGIFSYAWNDFDSARNIVYAVPSTDRMGNPVPGTTMVNQTARSETDGAQYSFGLSGGYDFTARGFTFGPYGRLSYLKANIDAFQERIDNTNPGFGLALGINEQDVESLTWALGGQVSYALSTGFGVLVPQARFEWEHEFLDNQRTITARFVSDPLRTPILLDTDDPDRDYFNLGAGLSAVFQRGVSAFVYYETALALRDVTAHQVAVGLRLAF